MLLDAESGIVYHNNTGLYTLFLFLWKPAPLEGGRRGGNAMRATIKMIAERAGVSIGTVDRVLHDRPYV